MVESINSYEPRSYKDLIKSKEECSPFLRIRLGSLFHYQCFENRIGLVGPIIDCEILVWFPFENRLPIEPDGLDEIKWFTWLTPFAHVQPKATPPPPPPKAPKSPITQPSIRLKQNFYFSSKIFRIDGPTNLLILVMHSYYLDFSFLINFRCGTCERENKVTTRSHTRYVIRL